MAIELLSLQNPGIILFLGLSSRPNKRAKFCQFFISNVSFFFKLIFIGVQWLYNVVLVSAVQQNGSAIHIHISPLFWISFPFRSPQCIKQSSLCYIQQLSLTFQAPGTGFVEDNFSTDWGWGGDGSGGNSSNGERWGAADEASLACPPLTSCSVAQFLTGHGPIAVRDPGVGDPCYTVCSHQLSILYIVSIMYMCQSLTIVLSYHHQHLITSYLFCFHSYPNILCFIQFTCFQSIQYAAVR